MRTMLFVFASLVAVALLAQAQEPAAKPATPSVKAPEPLVKAPAVKRDTITVIFGTEPKRARAHVYYGKEKLGRTPFEYEFKKDSGPVDIVYKSAGYLNVNTRVYTFSDSKLIVKMTKDEDQSSIYGYREEIPPDAGVPAPPTTPTSLPGVLTPTPTTAPPTPTPVPTP